MLVADHQSNSVPIQHGKIVPKDESVRSSILKRISKKKIEELAIQKYRICGKGIDFSDVTKFGCSKTKAQRILKDCSQQRIGRGGSLHEPLLFRSPKRTNPQRHYPSVLRADILEKLKQRGYVPLHLTELSSSKAPLSNLGQQKAQNLLDILFSLGRSPLYIHKLQLQLSLESRCRCSNNPFRLEDEADESILYSFLGQVRDRLMYLDTDPSECIVPPIIKWVLTGCDINKDITVTDMLQLSAINIQLKDANRVFRLYIKSLGDKAVYRVEESVKLRSRLVDVLHTIRSPSQLLYKQQD
ncbi:MAG: hypothetical protein WAM42_11520 [Candidatus Nitrosopolaris sp.]